MNIQFHKNALVKQLLNTVYVLFFIGLAIFALYHCFKDIKLDEFIEQLKSANYSFVVLSVIVGIFANIVRALRWGILINPIGYKPSTYNVYNAIMVGYMANLAIPRIGELMRCATLNKTDKIPIDSLFGTVVSERIIDLLCLVIALIIAFLLRMKIFSDFITEKLAPQWRILFENTTFGSVLLVAGLGIILITASYFVLKWLLKKPSMQKVKKIIHSLIDGLKSIFRMKQKLWFIACSVIIWVCYWLTSYLIILALPSTSALTPVDGLFLTALGSLGWIVPVPGGMGSFHTLIAWGLMMYGVTFNEGVIFATLAHESQLIGMIFFGLIALISVSLTKGKLSKLNQN
jgi:uncharacterized protein (TIRG00374 family)